MQNTDILLHFQRNKDQNQLHNQLSRTVWQKNKQKQPCIVTLISTCLESRYCLERERIYFNPTVVTWKHIDMHIKKFSEGKIISHSWKWNFERFNSCCILIFLFSGKKRTWIVKITADFSYFLNISLKRVCTLCHKTWLVINFFCEQLSALHWQGGYITMYFENKHHILLCGQVRNKYYDHKLVLRFLCKCHFPSFSIQKNPKKQQKLGTAFVSRLQFEHIHNAWLGSFEAAAQHNHELWIMPWIRVSCRGHAFTSLWSDMSENWNKKSVRLKHCRHMMRPFPSSAPFQVPVRLRMYLLFNLVLS